MVLVGDEGFVSLAHQDSVGFCCDGWNFGAGGDGFKNDMSL